MSLIAFYDAPTPPPGVFDKFLAIPTFENVNTVSTKSFADFVQGFGLFGDFSSAPRWVSRFVMQEVTELTESLQHFLRRGARFPVLAQNL